MDEASSKSAAEAEQRTSNYAPMREIHHTFREPDKRSPQVLWRSCSPEYFRFIFALTFASAKGYDFRIRFPKETIIKAPRECKTIAYERIIRGSEF